MKKWLKRFLYLLFVLFIILNISSAFHAYKFTHFYKDAVTIKKPEEMSFGDKMSAVFLGINYPKSKVVDSLLIIHETIKIKTSDSVTLEAWHLKQPDLGDSENLLTIKKGTVLIFHGHGSCKSALIKEANEFYKLGYEVVLTDFRAHGNSDGEVCTIGYNESKDVKAVFDYVKNTGEKNIVLYGVSLGAATIAKAVDEYNIAPTKVILEMPFGTLYDAVKGRVRTMKLPEQPISFLLTFWGGAEHGFWAFNHQPKEYVKKISCPVLLQWGRNDARVKETETNAVFNNIASANKKLVIYETCGHESLCKKENGKWRKNVGEFLK